MILAASPFDVHLIEEPVKGIGYAVDTGFGHAISNGAKLLARAGLEVTRHSDNSRQVAGPGRFRDPYRGVLAGPFDGSTS